MKSLITVLMLAAAPSFASPWAGKLDLSSIPAAAAYQSLTSADQAFGFQKHVWGLEYDGQEMMSLSVQASIVKPTLSAESPRFVAGPVIAVPGSLLDWTLGTTWGQQWLPKAKTGFTAAPDVTRLNDISVRNTFFGFGIAYPVGG
jgi:hypothetical protein